jgi:Domain of unknown function (DUF5063)
MGDVAAEFLRAARAYRGALAAEDVPEREFARSVRNALSRVYLTAALLGPPTTVTSDADPPGRRPADHASSALQERLEARFGEHDVFVYVFDPSRIVDEDTQPIEGTLSWQLVEIDEDLAESIAWLEEDAPDAAWHVRFAFEQHWGSHAVACLRPLHQMAVYGVV